MFKSSRKRFLFIAIAAMLITSCAAPQVVLPTPDLNLVRTEAVVTAIAQMTKEAALLPGVTQSVIIPEPAITSTPNTTTATPYIYSSGGTSGGTSGGSSGGSSGGTPIPTWTPVIYSAQFITQEPLDGYPCLTGEMLDFKIRLKNTGAATWNTSYYYKRLYNNPDYKLTTKDQYMLSEDVPSGSKITLTIDIECPKYPSPQAWTTQWGLVNDNGEIFARFYFRFYTVVHGEPTLEMTRTQFPG